jgi:hypothetical protein
MALHGNCTPLTIPPNPLRSSGYLNYAGATMHLIEDTSQLDIGKLKKVYVRDAANGRITSSVIATNKQTCSTAAA